MLFGTPHLQCIPLLTMLQLDIEIYNYFVARLPLIYCLISGFGFSIQSLIVKLLAEEGLSSSFQCVFARGLCQLIIVSFFLYFDADRRAGKAPALFGDTWYVRMVLLLRSVAGYLGIAFKFLSTELLPMGDSGVLVMLGPLLASILGFLVLGESWRLPEFIGTVVSLCGATLVAKPTFIFGHSSSGTDEKEATLGVIFALLAALSYGFSYLSVRMLGTVAKMPWANVVLVQALGQVILAIPSALVAGQHLTLFLSRREYALIITLGVVGAFSQILMTIGMQREKSALATGMRMSDVVFGFIWQAAFTADSVSVLSVIGATLVAGSILMMMITKETAAQSQVKTGFESGSNAPEFNMVNLTLDDDEVGDADLNDNPLWKGKGSFTSMSIMTGASNSAKQKQQQYTQVSLTGDEEDGNL